MLLKTWIFPSLESCLKKFLRYHYQLVGTTSDNEVMQLLSVGGCTSPHADALDPYSSIYLCARSKNTMSIWGCIESLYTYRY